MVVVDIWNMLDLEGSELVDNHLESRRDQRRSR